MKVSTLSSAHEARKQCNFDQNNSKAVYIAFSESCKPKRFVWCLNKVERNHIQKQQPSQFHCYNQKMGFVNRMDEHLPKHRIGIRMKKWQSDPQLFERQMLFFSVCGYCIILIMKLMSDCPSYLFEEMLSMQLF